MGELRVMGTKGDTKIIWDSDNEDEVKAAQKQFEELTKKGFVAFKMKKAGDKGEKITEFNRYTEQIILVPPIKGG